MSKIVILRQQFLDEQAKLETVKKAIVKHVGDSSSVDVPEKLFQEIGFTFIRFAVFEARLKKAMKGE